MTQARRHDLIALAILSLTATLLFADVLVGTHNFYLRDLTRYYYPTKEVVRDIVLDGEFPYWNRQFAAGQPIAANPEHEVFYPLTWLILLPDYFLGYRLHILVHVYIGLFAMYALLRSMRCRAPAAFMGALSWGLGGIYMSYINLLPIMFCAAWLPLTCLYVRKFLLEPRLRWFALGSLFLGLQCLVGEPTTVMQTGFILGMYAMYRGWYAARDIGLSWKEAVPEMFSRIVFIGLISIGGFLIGAAQMLPAMDHVADSARSRAFDFWLVSAWSMPWAKAAEMIYPNILGHMSIDQITWYWAGGLYPGMGSPFLFNIYPGLLVTALAAAAFFIRPRGGRFVLILTTFSVLLALGGHTPLLAWLYDLGIASSVRYPEKFLLIAIFSITVFAARGFDRMLRKDPDGRIREALLGFIAAVTIVAIAVSLIGLTPYYKKVFADVWGLKGGSAAAMVKLSLRGWVIAAARGAILLALIWSLPRIRRPLWIALAGVFVIADLAPVVHQLNPRMPAKFFLEPPPIVRSLPANREPFRIFHEADWYGQEETAKKYFGTGSAVYWIVRGGLFPMTPAGHGFSMVMERDYDKTALLPTIDFTSSVWDVKRSGREDWWRPMMAMSNAWYRAGYRDFAQEKKRTKGKMKESLPIRFAEAAHAPRYYFSDQMITVKDRKEFVDRLSKEDFSAAVAFVHVPSFVPAAGVVHGYRETANTATIDVESSGRGFLVMSVTPHKYWTITIDGRRTEPIVTNIGYQGIVVPAGRHRVEMRYRNTLVPTGVTISLSATLLLLGAAVWPGRRRI